MAENNTLLGLGLLYFFISLASIVIWIYLYPLIMILYIIGSIALFISGIIFLSGGSSNNKNTIGTGFGFGVVAWILILGSCFVGLIWNLNKLGEINFGNLVALIFALDTEDDLVRGFFLALIIDNTAHISKRFRIGFTGSIVHILIIIIEIIIGSLALNIVKKEKW